MAGSPLISVIMPVYNAKKYLLTAIDSIVSQTYTNWELLICDDASTDGSAEVIADIAKRDPRIKVYRNSTNLKVLKTRNRLLELANGTLITFQDADDYSDSERLEQMVKEFQSNPRLGLLSSQVRYIDAHGNILRVSNKPTDYESTLNLVLNENVVGGSISMIKKEALDAVGGRFRQFLDGLSNQDYDLSLLICEKYECYALSDILYYYRQHETSNSKTVDPDRIIARELVKHLAKQRKNRGSDDVMDGNIKGIETFMQDHRRPYTQDASLVYREYAANFMFNKLFKKAIQTSFIAVKKQPLRFVNWRTLLYCARMSLLQTVFKW